MSERSQALLKIRPQIPSARITPEITSDEHFQNGTLRPILKFQNPLLLVMFRNYITKHKNRFYELTEKKRMDYIENAVQKDVKFRNSLKGMIIGQFTVEEYARYIQNSSALNKRMMNMVIDRLKDQVQWFQELLIQN
ncbi:MAG: glyoxalase [Bacteroidota bacterium]